MGIKEKDLQTIEQLSDGDKLRVVTSDGNSRNIDAENIGGGSDTFVVNVVGDRFPRHLDKTYAEIREAWQSKHVVLNESYIRGANCVEYITTIYSMTIESYTENEFLARVYTTSGNTIYYYAQGTTREEAENATLMEYGD